MPTMKKKLVAFNFTPEISRVVQFGTSDEAQCIFQLILTLQASYCSEVPTKSYSIQVLLIRFLTLLSTYVQSLEPSIQESKTLGSVKSVADGFTYSLFQRFSGFLA